jgi:hypothetical protein
MEHTAPEWAINGSHVASPGRQLCASRDRRPASSRLFQYSEFVGAPAAGALCVSLAHWLQEFFTRAVNKDVDGMKNNAKPVIAGIIVGFVVFAGFFMLRASHHSAPAQPGSVTVRPIQNQDGGLRMAFALGLGVAAGFGAYWSVRRASAKNDKNDKA